MEENKGELVWAYMDKQRDGEERKISIRDLYPHLNDAQLKVAAENWQRYLELMLGIYERIKGDPKEYARFKALTGKKLNPRMKA